MTWEPELVASGASTAATGPLQLAAGAGLGSGALPAKGDLLVAFAATNTPANQVTGISDPAAGAYTLGRAQGTNQAVAMYAAIAPRDYTSSDVFTFDYIGSGNKTYCVMRCPGGASAAASPVASGQANSASASSGVASPFVVPSLAIGATTTASGGGIVTSPLLASAVGLGGAGPWLTVMWEIADTPDGRVAGGPLPGSGQHASVIGGYLLVPDPLVITTVLPDATVGEAYDVELEAAGGVPPYEWDVSGLPPGLSQSGGRITGTPEGA